MFRKCKECEMLRVRIEHLENEIRRKDEFIDKVKIFYFNQIKGKNWRKKGRYKKISFLRLWEVQGGKPCRYIVKYRYAKFNVFCPLK